MAWTLIHITYIHDLKIDSLHSKLKQIFKFCGLEELKSRDPNPHWTPLGLFRILTAAQVNLYNMSALMAKWKQIQHFKI